jgi:hypothetical protein
LKGLGASNIVDVEILFDFDIEHVHFTRGSDLSLLSEASGFSLILGSLDELLLSLHLHLNQLLLPTLCLGLLCGPLS